jgi:class 3 adenylate cyclase
MFSDLVGSTAFSARMDPEDLREIISTYQKCVTETVQRFGGFVAKYMGDGVLVYFGYPQAQQPTVHCYVGGGSNCMLTSQPFWKTNFQKLSALNRSFSLSIARKPD